MKATLWSSNAPIAVVDTCSIFPPSTRDLLVQLAILGAYELVLTDIVVLELRRTLLNKTNLEREVCDSLVSKLVEAFDPETTQTFGNSNDERLFMHAVTRRANFLVTENLKHYPKERAPTAISTDDFLIFLDSLNPGILMQAAQLIVARYRRPSMSLENFAAHLSDPLGMTKSAAAISQACRDEQ